MEGQGFRQLPETAINQAAGGSRQGRVLIGLYPVSATVWIQCICHICTNLKYERISGASYFCIQAKWFLVINCDSLQMTSRNPLKL